MPDAVKTAATFAASARPGKKILFFSTLHYWIEQSAYISLVLAGLGHKITLMTLSYSEWHKRMDNFTQRQRMIHTRETLKPIQSLVKHVSLLDLKPVAAIPDVLRADIEQISLWDTQYTLMREEVDMNNVADRSVYDLRLERNTFAARAALAWIQANKPDVVLVPNGLILEMGIVFRVARYL